MSRRKKAQRVLVFRHLATFVGASGHYNEGNEEHERQVRHKHIPFTQVTSLLV